MRRFHSPRPLLNVALVLVVLALAVSACAASSDASKARSRALINQGIFVPAEEVRVAEYINYYEQRFPAPTDTPLGLDLRIGNPQIPTGGGDIWLQIGLRARDPAEGEVTPLNLALVIDRSGSMDTADKMPYLKQSLRVFFESLQPDDYIAVVAYDTEAEVILPARRVGEDLDWIQGTIDRLQPNGSTNLHGGLMLGFQEAAKNYDIRRNNRVLLLTDGIANVGVTDPEEIAADALTYNQQGIYLSTIGLGLDFNDALLSTLAQQGQGAYHFIDSASEMDKVFRAEVAGLVETVASDVMVAIRPAAGIVLAEITGYDGTPPDGGVQVELQDMGAGNTQVLLVRLQVPAGEAGERPLADVTLTYTDIFGNRSRTADGQVEADAQALTAYDPLVDAEVLRTVTIKRSAEALQAIDGLVKTNRYREAWELAQDIEEQLRRVAEMTADDQMVRDADLFARYQETLAQLLEEAGDEPPPTAMVSPVQTPRWGQTNAAPDATPTLPVINVK